MTAASAHPADALLSLVYGELSAEDARSVQAHLDGCAECTATLASYRAVREAARALPRELPSAAGVQPLLLAAQASTTRAQRRRRTLWTGSLLAGAAAAALAAVAVRPRLAPETPAAVASAPAAAPMPQGALALNTPPRPEERPALREEAAVPRQAPVVAKTARAKAAVPASEAGARRDVVALASEAKKAESPPVGAPAALGAVRPSAAARLAAGAPVPATAGAAARASAPATAGALLSVSADAAASPEAVAQHARDEDRLQALLLRLPQAPAAQVLPLLSELCALEERLGHPGEARAACTRVVQGYPGTPEAIAARATLDRLGPGQQPP